MAGALAHADAVLLGDPQEACNEALAARLCCCSALHGESVALHELGDAFGWIFFFRRKMKADSKKKINPSPASTSRALGMLVVVLLVLLDMIEGKVMYTLCAFLKLAG